MVVLVLQNLIHHISDASCVPLHVRGKGGKHLLGAGVSGLASCRYIMLLKNGEASASAMLHSLILCVAKWQKMHGSTSPRWFIWKYNLPPAIQPPVSGPSPWFSIAEPVVHPFPDDALLFAADDMVDGTDKIPDIPIRVVAQKT